MDAEQGEIVEDKHEKDRKKEKKHKSHKEHKSSKDHKSSKEKHKDKDKERSKRSAEVPIAENYANGADGHVHEAGNEAAKAAREEGKDSHREKHKKDGEVRERDSRAEGKEKQKSSHREGRDHADRDERDRQRDTERDRKAERVSEKDKRSSGRRASPIPEPPSKRGGEDGQPAMQDSGGEISMSIEETNKLRASLGLKPLTDGFKADDSSAAHAKKVAEAEKKAKTEDLAERIKSQREKREMEKQLRSTKTLGAAAPEVDDLAAWVERSRAAEAAQKAAERAKAEKVARQFAEEDEEMEGSDSEEEGRPVTAAELAGVKVRHRADELVEGQTVILTLADRAILDEHGELDDQMDELEEAAMAEQKKRAKAMKAATKINKPLFGEDGVERGLLEKYDEEAAEEGLVLDDSGRALEERRRQDIRAKLALAQSAAVQATDTTFNSRSEYYSKEEMAALFKPKKKKKKKVLRKKVDEDEELTELAKTTAALEAAAEVAGTGRSDHGSRALRESLAAKEAAASAEKAAQRTARYERALEKANYRSLALRNNAAEAGGSEEAQEEGEEEAELQETLAWARRAAQAKAEGLSDIAAVAARRRQQQEAADREGALAFTEAAEFARTIELRAPEADAQDEEMYAEPSASKTPAVKKEERPPGAAAWGSWVTPEQDAENQNEEAAEGRARRAAAKALKDEPEDDIVGIIHERPIGRGLGGALSLLNERKELSQPVQWAGRTNDMRPEKLMGLEDVYTGGRQQRDIDARVEAALTRRDEFGRVLTPKESFRQLCYKFHGKDPSKNKQEKRLRKIQEEMEQRRLASSEQPEHSSVKRLHAIQEVSATPYLVLSGKIKPGQISDPSSGYATEDWGGTSTRSSFQLAGGETPLVGKRKVEVMLGLNGQATPVGNASMPPPPPRRPKTEPV